MADLNSNGAIQYYRFVRAWLRGHHLLVFACVALLAFALGIVGFCQQGSALKQGQPITSADGGKTTSISDAIFKTAQLFLLNSGGSTNHWCLQLARFLALGLIVTTVYHLFKNIFDLARIQLWGSKHIVIVGAGRVGQQLVTDYSNGTPWKRKVVVIERDPENPTVERCRELGAAILFGDGTDQTVLKQARVDTAEKVFAVCGMAAVNIEVAVRVAQVRTATPTRIFRRWMKRPQLECHAHISDTSLSDVFERYPMAVGTDEAVTIRPFNVYRMTARKLVREEFTKNLPGKDELAHYVLFGFGGMGQAIARCAVQLGHFQNHKRLRMSIVDRNITEGKHTFLERFPRFCPRDVELDLTDKGSFDDEWTARMPGDSVGEGAAKTKGVSYACNAEFLELPLDIDDEKFLSRLRDRIAQPKVRANIIVAFEDEYRSFETAVRLQDHLSRSGLEHIPVYVWLAQHAGLAELFAGDENEPPGRPKVFGQRHLVCNAYEVTQQTLEEVAKASHANYVAHLPRKEKENPRRSALPWNQLAETYRDSNRLAADHMAIKLATAGCRLNSRTLEIDSTSGQGADELTLAHMEHNRWLADRLLEGWTYGPEKDEARKLHSDIVPWKLVFKKTDRAKDVNQVRGMLDILDKARRELEQEKAV